MKSFCSLEHNPQYALEQPSQWARLHKCASAAPPCTAAALRLPALSGAAAADGGAAVADWLPARCGVHRADRGRARPLRREPPQHAQSRAEQRDWLLLLGECDGLAAGGRQDVAAAEADGAPESRESVPAGGLSARETVPSSTIARKVNALSCFI
eukprot:4784170-Pleurochrysis_carterae.AAC.15